MASQPVPEDEMGRLEKLRGLGFDRFDEAPFVQRLVDIAAGRFDTDLSYVAIMDEDRQNILACAGADVKTADRAASTCVYTIMQDDVLVIEDILEDERFADNKLLHEKGINWYAGVSIAIDGYNIGTFCLMDRENQDMDTRAKNHLKGFAEEMEEQVVLRNQIYDMKSDSIAEEVHRKFEMF